MLNHIDLMGRLVRDPELRYTNNQTAVASFTLAVDEDYAPKGEQKKAIFVDCVAWRNTAEFVNNYFKKGSTAVVSGRLSFREWTDKDNNKRRNAEVVVDQIYFADSKRSTGTGNAEPEFTDEPDDDGDLPF